ncbi:MAG: hypothetical protein FJ146_08440 [Deltaproteobacteria bacterium]|nr:hypothetical protein [Deltaproteobacteria bacterium]
MFCSHIVNTLGDQGCIIDVTIDDITTTLNSYIASLGGEFETYLDNYTRNEVRVLTLIAKQEILRNPMGKDNLSILKISASGLRKILEKLLDHADIYREKNGYVLSKPLLMHYLRDWRL